MRPSINLRNLKREDILRIVNLASGVSNEISAEKWDKTDPSEMKTIYMKYRTKKQPFSTMFPYQFEQIICNNIYHPEAFARHLIAETERPEITTDSEYIDRCTKYFADCVKMLRLPKSMVADEKQRLTKQFSEIEELAKLKLADASDVREKIMKALS